MAGGVAFCLPYVSLTQTPLPLFTIVRLCFKLIHIYECVEWKFSEIINIKFYI
ncbi:hypothetical protein HanIR_Chr01g0004721 [Helianthus annuus]|nr:hypothetical protein HanIR_Chr01g0004721 [Helianthus annuus]